MFQSRNQEIMGICQKFFEPKGNKVLDLIREHFLYSDGMSFQDILFWDLFGAGLGNFVRLLLLI
jgi:hypothetical protein